MGLIVTLEVPAQVPNLAVIRHFVEETAAAFGAGRDAIEDVLQAVDETAVNIIVHGYGDQPGSSEVQVVKENGTLVVRLRDHAPLFDPTLVPPPDLTTPLEERRMGGLGLHLARHFVDSVTYRTTSEGGNELTLLKKVSWIP